MPAPTLYVQLHHPRHFRQRMQNARFNVYSDLDTLRIPQDSQISKIKLLYGHVH